MPVVQGLADAGLVLEDVTGGTVTYRLAHPLLTEVAAGRLPEVARRRLHARLADCLRRRDPGRVDQLAHHLAGAGDEVDPAEALEVIQQAVDRGLESGAGAAAARHADAALVLSRRLGRDDLVASLLERRARGLDLAEDLAALDAWVVAADAHRRNGRTRDWARLLTTISIAEWDRGRFDDALTHVEQAVAALEPWFGSPEHGRALCTWAM